MNTNKLKEFIKKDIILIISLLLALISCFFSIPKLEYIDFKVLILLFNLMIVIAAFKELKILDNIAINLLKKCTSLLSLNLILVLLTFFTSMLVTNDVALITFIPLTIIISKKSNIDILKTVIFQTIAANLGSSFTPMGNPQNLYIYSFYNLKPNDFFKTTSPLVLISLLFLLFIVAKNKNKEISFKLDNVEITNKKFTLVFTLLFFIILLSVFHLINYKLVFLITIITVIFTNKKLFLKVDYSLLLTFIGFFIFIGNISALDNVRLFMEEILKSKESTFMTSIITSQVISNVPATILLSNFTNYTNELLLGVNIGGLGTLIASLASVISYKFYSNEFPTETNKYLKFFIFYNILGLAILIPIIYLFIHL